MFVPVPRPSLSAALQACARRPLAVLGLGVVLSFVLHLPVLPRDLYGIHAWRQTQTQTVINNFAREDWNLFRPRYNAPADGPRIVRMEVPLMQWAFAGVERTVGGGVRGSRLLTFVLFALSVLGMYRLGLALFGRNVPALLCAWGFLWSPVLFYYCVCPLPDNAALCSGVWMLAYTLKFLGSGRPVHMAAAALFLGLATAMKLPFVVLGAAIIPALFARTIPGRLRLFTAGLCVLALLPAAAWYAWVIPTWTGNGVVGGVLSHGMGSAEVQRILSHYFISAGPELFINYGALLPFFAGTFRAIRRRVWRTRAGAALLCSLAGAAAYVVYELPLIGVEHDYYLFPLLPFVFLLVGYGGEWCLQRVPVAVKWLVAAGFLVLPLTAALRCQSRFSLADPGIPRSLFSSKAALQTFIPPHTRVVVLGDPSSFIVLYHLNRKGWAYPRGGLSAADLALHVAAGATALVVVEDAALPAELSTALRGPVFHHDDLRIYTLPPLHHR